MADHIDMPFVLSIQLSLSLFLALPSQNVCVTLSTCDNYDTFLFQIIPNYMLIIIMAVDYIKRQYGPTRVDTYTCCN